VTLQGLQPEEEEQIPERAPEPRLDWDTKHDVQEKLKRMVQDTDTDIRSKAQWHSLPIPFGKVHLVKKVDAGSQGEVFEGTIDGLNERVAIKSLWNPNAPRRATNQGPVDLKAELSTLVQKVNRMHLILAAMATHPHVVRFVGISFSEDQRSHTDTSYDVNKHKIYLITEFVEGCKLPDLYGKDMKALTDELLVIFPSFRLPKYQHLNFRFKCSWKQLMPCISCIHGVCIILSPLRGI